VVGWRVGEEVGEWAKSRASYRRHRHALVPTYLPPSPPPPLHKLLASLPTFTILLPPPFQAFLASLDAAGQSWVPIVDPGVKVDPGEGAGTACVTACWYRQGVQLYCPWFQL